MIAYWSNHRMKLDKASDEGIKPAPVNTGDGEIPPKKKEVTENEQ